MFAGTDLHVISSIANSSNFVTQRLPMSLLTIRQVFSFVQSTQEFARLLDYSQVCRNLFFLGGVPRWAVEYLLALKTESNVLSLEMIEKCYTTITDTYVTSAFSVLNPRQRLRLAAFALSGRLVQPDELFDDKLTWSRLRDSSLCLLTPRSDRGYEIVVPYSLFRNINVPRSLSQAEVFFASAIVDMREFVDSKLFDIPPWKSWEVFGACFYALRINALLFLGHSTVKLGSLLRGATMDEQTSAIQVKLVPSTVFRCAQNFGSTTGQILTRQGNTLETIDWISSGCIAMNGEGGEGVDIFFALEHAVTGQVVVVVDQRKRQFGKFQPGQARIYLDKLSQSPSFLTNAILVRGIMNCVSVSNLASYTVPPYCFLISREQNDEFHGSLSYHPACSPFISVNTANKTAIQSLFIGSVNEVREVVEEIIRKRAEPNGGFSNEDDLHSIIHAKKVRVELDSEFLEFSY
ncbi:Aste57867_7999 [Aphanomyces stellatus]|uniref:Aste57867_7999 protein n=1 Tax=Aphanomyces stellatus TaxID=120398 RepID=A0A485KJ81_9STRA|nr:hypothetical protein As57867_007969 [Aphanomyces stellatus]VFT84892.1 Aste57867_7999 [Aphanomyces stellatus]